MTQSHTVASVAPERLFSPIRSTNTAYLYTESEYELLSRASGPLWDRVRDAIEQWYARYPDTGGDLRARFRDTDPRQHAAAWWELYVYTLFRSLAYDMEVHPALTGSSRRPDFLAQQGNTAIYIECAVAFDSPNSARADSEAWLKDCINAVASPDFGFSLRINSAGLRRAQKADVIAQIEGWVSQLDYEAERATRRDGEPGPSKRFTFADSIVTLTALALPPQQRGTNDQTILIGPAVTDVGETSIGRLKKLVNKKASQCRAVNDTFIVAVLNRMVFAQQRQVDQAMFGRESSTYLLNEDVTAVRSVERKRLQDGLWHPGPPPRGGRVSGVLFGENLSAAYVAARLPTLWVNPWASRRIPDGLPFQRRSANEGGVVFNQADATAQPGSILALPAE